MRAPEDQTKPRTSELLDSDSLKQFTGHQDTIVDIISASALDTRTLGHYLAFKNGRSFLITGNQRLHTIPSHYHYGDIDCEAFSKLSCSHQDQRSCFNEYYSETDVIVLDKIDIGPL